VTAPERKPVDVASFCVRGIGVCVVVLMLLFGGDALASRNPWINSISRSMRHVFDGVAQMTFFAISTLIMVLIVAIPIQGFAQFKAGGYKLNLRQMFLLTAILALVFAIVGLIVRSR
jgi:hypothetical protein